MYFNLHEAEENNAFTETTHTNFYFDCSNEGFY